MQKPNTGFWREALCSKMNSYVAHEVLCCISLSFADSSKQEVN